MVKVGNKSFQAGRKLYWTEFWRDLERVDHSNRTSPCDARCEVMA
jgi:hypothetical protein